MLSYLTSGESHGARLTAIMDGFPSGVKLAVEKIDFQLARRQKGYGRGGRMKIEIDRVKIISGVRGGISLGSPITLDIDNKDWPNWSESMSTEPTGKRKSKPLTRPRPGHADLAGAIKYHQYDLRNVLERASARETAARVALGALARQLLEHFQIDFASHVVRIGPVSLDAAYDLKDLNQVREITENSPVRCLDGQLGEQMVKAIDNAQRDGDSLGGVAEVIIRGLPVGLGGFSQGSKRLDSRLAGAVVSIPSVKGVEFGRGFECSVLRGSEVQDEIFYNGQDNSPRKGFYRLTNHAGGLEGGMTNGEDIVFRAAVKPVSTLAKPLTSVDLKTREKVKAIFERADVCVVPAVAVIAENIAALVLVEAFLEKFGSDNLSEIETNYKNFLQQPF